MLHLFFPSGVALLWTHRQRQIQIHPPPSKIQKMFHAAGGRSPVWTTGWFRVSYLLISIIIGVRAATQICKNSIQNGLVPALVPLGSTWFQNLLVAGFPCKTAWFRPWFHLVPHGSTNITSPRPKFWPFKLLSRVGLRIRGNFHHAIIGLAVL